MLEIKTRWFNKPDSILFINRHAKRSLKVFLGLERGKRLYFAVGPFENGCRRKTFGFSERMVVEINIAVSRHGKISGRIVQSNQFFEGKRFCR